MSKGSSNPLTSIIRFISILTAALTALFISPRPSAHNGGKLTTLVAPPWKHTLGLPRIGQAHLDFYSGYRKKFLNPQGVVATKHYFNDDESAKDDDELTIYGVNSGSGEIFYNKSMTSLGFFGKPGGGAGEFRDAVGVACDADGNVYVADRGNNRIVHLRNIENELIYNDAFDLAESGMPLQGPTGVCVELDTVYIADTGNDRLVVADSAGRMLRKISRRAGLVQPFAIAAIAQGPWNFYGSRFIVVTDSLNQRLTKLALDGTPIASCRFSEVSGVPGGFFFVAIDFYSNIYVTDMVGGCLYKFDRYLRFVTRHGCGTGTADDLVEPRGVTVYRRFGQVFVAEKAGAIYYWVGTDVQGLRGTATSSGGTAVLQVRFLLTEQSRVSIHLETQEGDVIKELTTGRFMEPGPHTRRYELVEGELPCPIAKCTYVVRVSARATYSSVKYHNVEKKTPLRY